MQFSAILCLATYDWFCADGSHIKVDMLMVDTSWANLILNYNLTNIVMKLLECIVCYRLHNLITLRHDIKPCKISSDISWLLLNTVSQEIKI